MFATGPARATHSISVLGDLRALVFTGTGFAQPNKNPDDMINKLAGTKIVPIGSTCLIGLRVRRPSILALASPKIFATQPCATS
jgi:hypothetical protein